MCSVIGYIGKKSGESYIINGLKKLEYRGYDSTGIAIIPDIADKIFYKKSIGPVDNLIGNVKKTDFGYKFYNAIGHTRWATHGNPCEVNAHPHFDCKNSIAVVHNGIIENYKYLKLELENKGHIFRSSTDTEVIPHLLEDIFDSIDISCPKKRLQYALISLSRKLEGAYAIAIIHDKYPNNLIALRFKSPLLVAFNKNFDQAFLSSDLYAFYNYADIYGFIEDNSILIIEDKDRISFEVIDKDSNIKQIDLKNLDNSLNISDIGQYKHFMLKEIYEQKSIISKIADNFELNWIDIKSKLNLENIENIDIIGAGTSYHAGLIGEFFFNKINSISCYSFRSCEFKSKKYIKKSLTLALSQSGETADTLEAIRFIKDNGNNFILSLTNHKNSTLANESIATLLMQAGHEISVASTKSFTAQLAILYLLANKLINNDISKSKQLLKDIAYFLEFNIDVNKLKLEALVDIYYKYDRVIFLARDIMYPLALEAALKIKEIAYIWADCYPAGELKHGPLALIENGIIIFVISHYDNLVYKKLLSNVQEAKARGAIIISFLFKGQNELIELSDNYIEVESVDDILLSPISMIGIIQYFIYKVAEKLERPIDKPRNLAKSVTVE